MTSNPIQKQMLADLQDEKLFDRAQRCGLDYLAQVFERRVSPAPEDVERLKELGGSPPRVKIIGTIIQRRQPACPSKPYC